MDDERYVPVKLGVSFQAQLRESSVSQEISECIKVMSAARRVLLLMIELGAFTYLDQDLTTVSKVCFAVITPCSPLQLHATACL